MSTQLYPIQGSPSLKTIIVCFLFIVLNIDAVCLYSQEKTFRVTLTNASDAEYPHNNMIGFKSKHSGKYVHKKATISENSNGNFDIIVLPANDISDTIYLKNINLLEFLPTIPSHVKNDDYLSHLAVLNQEWNRIQVKFTKDQYEVGQSGSEKSVITRIDLANNCLAKGLWEILAFTSENGSDKLYFQCWFDFPSELYDRLFLKRNGTDIRSTNDALLNYQNTKSKKVDLKMLRKVLTQEDISFISKNNEYYPLKGERETKRNNIVYPISVASIDDLLTDQTTFATFAAPGQYTRLQPRKTELGRFKKLHQTKLLQTVSTNVKNTPNSEIHLSYQDNQSRKTTLVLGGLQLDKLPILSNDNMHKGWQRPMGISNHSFYNSYDEINANSSADNSYFALLIDDKGKWLDSHNVGIDGVLMYRDVADSSLVHLLILGFERHAFVGHTIINIPKNQTGHQSNKSSSDNVEVKKLNFYGDMRSRLVEHDWKVTTQDGIVLDPRTRMRLRLRLGFSYQYSKTLSFGGRIRTGSPNEQQSPHLTLGSTENANLSIGLDRAFVKFSKGAFTAWSGKHTFPFYTHDDLFVTSDISPEGLYTCYEFKIGKVKIKPAVAYFIINTSGKSLERDRNMNAAQVLASYKNDKNELKISTAYFVLDSLGNTPDGTENFVVNYHQSYSNLKYTYNGSKLPLSIAGNFMINLANLNKNAPVLANNHQDQKTGYSITLEVGSLNKAKDCLISMTYAHIEKYALLDYFAQDDWMRWGFSGGAGGTRGSNYKGLEIRAAYAIGPNCNLVARTYLIDGISKNKPTAAALETNNRFRLDFNIGF